METQPKIPKGSLLKVGPQDGEVWGKPPGQEGPLEPLWLDKGPLTCPYGKFGDHLWVRETHALIWPDEFVPEREEDHLVEYRADHPDERLPGNWPEEMRGDEECPRWKPSLHMKRWASRITLEITDVRVEQIQEISEAGAQAEGITHLTNYPIPSGYTHRGAFAALWDGIYGGNLNHGGGPDAWSQNPWVWVIEFKRVSQ